MKWSQSILWNILSRRFFKLSLFGKLASLFYKLASLCGKLAPRFCELFFYIHCNAPPRSPATVPILPPLGPFSILLPLHTSDSHTVCLIHHILESLPLTRRCHSH